MGPPNYRSSDAPSGKSKEKRRDLSFREVFMQESQLDKMLRQTFLFVKAARRGRIQN